MEFIINAWKQVCPCEGRERVSRTWGPAPHILRLHIHWRSVVILMCRRLQPAIFSPLRIDWGSVWARSPSGKSGNKEMSPLAEIERRYLEDPVRSLGTIPTTPTYHPLLKMCGNLIYVNLTFWHRSFTFKILSFLYRASFQHVEWKPTDVTILFVYCWVSTCFGPTGPSSGEFVQLFIQPLVQYLYRYRARDQSGTDTEPMVVW